MLITRLHEVMRSTCYASTLVSSSPIVKSRNTWIVYLIHSMFDYLCWFRLWTIFLFKSRDKNVWYFSVQEMQLNFILMAINLRSWTLTIPTWKSTRSLLMPCSMNVLWSLETCCSSQPFGSIMSSLCRWEIHSVRGKELDPALQGDCFN